MVSWGIPNGSPVLLLSAPPPPAPPAPQPPLSRDVETDFTKIASDFYTYFPPDVATPATMADHP